MLGHLPPKTPSRPVLHPPRNYVGGGVDGSPSSKVSYEPLGPHRFAHLPTPPFFPLLQSILICGSFFCAFVYSDAFHALLGPAVVFLQRLRVHSSTCAVYSDCKSFLEAFSHRLVFLMPQSSLPGRYSI